MSKKPLWERRMQSVLEKVTNAYKIITSDHASIHRGQGFNASLIYDDFDNNETYNYKFKACLEENEDEQKYIHFKQYKVFSTASVVEVKLIEVDEDIDHTGGTEVEPVNRSRINGLSSCIDSYAGMSVDLTGKTTKVLEQFYVGGGGIGAGRIGGDSELDIEFVLKPGRTYLFQFKNISGQNDKKLGLWFFWYEEEYAR